MSQSAVRCTNDANQLFRLLQEVMVLFRGGSIQAFNSLKHDASEVSSAFKSFSTKGRGSKVAVSFEDDESLIKVSKYQKFLYSVHS